MECELQFALYLRTEVSVPLIYKIILSFHLDLSG